MSQQRRILVVGKELSCGNPDWFQRKITCQRLGSYAADVLPNLQTTPIFHFLKHFIMEECFVMSNVLLINGSPNEQGNTWTALNEVAKTLEHHGVGTKWVYLSKQPIAGCIACYKCVKAGKCIFDDQVNQVIDLLDQYDGMVIGSPVYFAGPNGHLCAFLDRLFWAGGKKMAGKLAAAVVCCRRGGASAALDRLNRDFTSSNMYVVGSSYWNMVHGMRPGEAKDDLEGMHTMRTLGENMAWMLKSMEAGKSAGRSGPEHERKVFTNFIR